MNRKWRQAAGWVLACAVCWGTCGCITVPVWRRTIREEWAGEAHRVGEGEVTVAKENVRVWAEGRGGGRVAIGVKGAGKKTWQRERPLHRVEVVKWKWVSAGAFPGMAESIYRSKKSLRPLYGRRYSVEMAGTGVEAPPTQQAIGGILLSWLFWTPVAAPFELLGFVPHECGSHHWDGTNAVLLTKFSSVHRDKIGAWTWWDDQKQVHQRPTKSGYTHYMLAGFHRYCTYTVGDVEVVGAKEANPETEFVSGALQGPYSVEVRIPKIDWTEKWEVPAEADEVVVDLPEGARGRVELEVEVQVEDPKQALKGKDGFQRALLKAAHGMAKSGSVAVRE